LRVNPGRQLSPTQPLTDSPQWDGEEKRPGRVKVQKLLGGDKDSLTGKAKAARNSFTNSYQQAGV